MVTVGPAAILMSGKPGEAAFVDIRSIGGLSADVTRQLSQKDCALLAQSSQVPQNRIYLNFSGVEAGNWGVEWEYFRLRHMELPDANGAPGRT
jgi:phenylpyruvate tautomerase